MTHSTLILLILAIFIGGCAKTTELNLSNPSKKVELISYANINAPLLIRKSGINEFRLRRDGKTRQDLENFYASLSKKYTNPVELSVLQAMTAALLLDEYGMLKSAEKSDLPAIEKYVNIIRVTQYAPPSLYIKIVRGLQKHWTKNQVNELKNHFLAISSLEKNRLEEILLKHKMRLNNEKTLSVDKKIIGQGIVLIENSLKAIEDLKNM